MKLFILMLLLLVGAGITANFFIEDQDAFVKNIAQQTETAIESYDKDLNNIDTLDTVLKNEDKESIIQESISYLHKNNSESEIIASIYLLSNSGDKSNAENLIPLLEHPNEQIRITAAARLATWGYAEAIPVLIQALAENPEIRVPGSTKEIWTLAQEVLPNITDQDFGLKNAIDNIAASKTREQWLTWWEKEGQNLIWEEQYGIFR